MLGHDPVGMPPAGTVSKRCANLKCGSYEFLCAIVFRVGNKGNAFSNFIGNLHKFGWFGGSYVADISLILLSS